MEQNQKRYWKGIEELTNDLEFVKNAEKEFPNYLPIHEQNGELSDDAVGSNRRDFLKLMGFSIAAVSLAACEAPLKKAIPYLNKPLDIDPSIPNYYASTYFQDNEYNSILVKTREGRPIKIEGNDLSAISKGKTSAKVQASVLDLYDETRFKGFFKKDKKLPETAKEREVQNSAIDEEIIKKLSSARNIRIVSPTIISPATKSVLATFKKQFPSTQQVTYDVFSASGILKANQATFGTAMVPSYDFGKAEVIVSFGADFLGTWLSPVEFATQYAPNRKLGENNKKMSRHYQFESRLSMTGANADYRYPVKASQEALLLVSLYKKLTGFDEFKDKALDKVLDKVSKDLKANKGKSLVVSSSTSADVQMVVNAINQSLNNYGKTILSDVPVYTHQGMDEEMDRFLDDVKGGRVDMVIFYGTNPVYSHPKGKELKEALSKVGTKISLAFRPDETTELCDYVCPDNHFLESWNDAEPRKGHFSISQPAITNIYNTRQAQESFLTWAGQKVAFYDYMRAFWQANQFKAQNTEADFVNFWNNAVHNGVFSTEIKAAPTVKEGGDKPKEGDEPTSPAKNPTLNVNQAIAAIQKNSVGKGVELTVYEKVGIGTGAQANNPWLQEMPDPITKACWANYLCISQSMAKEMQLKQDQKVKFSVGNFSAEVPVMVQPGQAPGTVSIALGYGREISGKVGTGVGVNVFPLAGTDFQNDVKIEKISGKDAIAQTQTHHTIMGRDIIQGATLKEYQKDSAAGRKQVLIHTDEGEKKPTEITLWKGHDYPNHSWGLVVDLNSCIGCSACTIACQVENNVPVVGKKEVLMRREMHWIRIDRYYSSPDDADTWAEMENAADNPEVTFMPLMCQHCNNAPCETVCPVLATTHSTEGLNQMAYNRCIGTRYCANNCPYKVRRFNWFHYAEDTRFTDINYTQTTDLGKMVLNPDVTVRSRGVMEKCSMCVQRIQSAKLEAKKEKRQIKDGEFTTACAQVCPTNALTFGDMNDANSIISKALSIKQEIIKGERGASDKKVYNITEPRAYHVLDEINIKPQVSYLTKIRNIDEVKAGTETATHQEEEKHG
ncbi:MAG: TAT-variant-translocated molybdopterin oxidoreductase [Microscillaceae bacterium]|nr:TAT-variant-translocated molybdopterin oxidoreductase [Microscillaceae bacterium]